MYSRVITTLIMAFSFLSYMTDTEAKNLKVTYAAIGGVTSVPYGWIDFCNRRKNAMSRLYRPWTSTSMRRR